jgi:hypothetical protein
MKLRLRTLVLLFFLISSISLGQTHRGTTVFAYCTHDLIVIGADSKFTSFDKKERLNGVGYGCKIFRGNDSVYFALSGNAIPFRDGENLLEQDARRACRKGTSLAAIASLFKSESIESLQPYIGVVEKLTADGVKGNYVSVAFFGFENGVASTYMLEYHDINILKRQDTSLIAGREMKAAYLPMKVELGNTFEIDQFLSTHHSYFGRSRDSITVAVNNLIGLEVLAHPAAVGGGVSILCIRPRSFEWWQGGCECKDF